MCLAEIVSHMTFPEHTPFFARRSRRLHMSWLITNWFWLLIFFAFIAMHLFGHGDHAGHGTHDQSSKQQGKDADA